MSNSSKLYEPSTAVIAENSFSAYEGIANSLINSLTLLKKGGIILFEVGSGQANDVQSIMSRVTYLELLDRVYDCHDQLRCLVYIRHI